jgi:hypothetical protein
MRVAEQQHAPIPNPNPRHADALGPSNLDVLWEQDGQTWNLLEVILIRRT